MSSRALTWAWPQKLKPGPKLLLIALADRADEDGKCYPSWRWISEKTGFSKGAIWSNLNKLADRNLVKVQQQRRKDGSKQSNLYSLRIPASFARNQGSKNEPSKQGSESEPHGLNSEPGSSESEHHNTSIYPSIHSSFAKANETRDLPSDIKSDQEIAQVAKRIQSKADSKKMGEVIIWIRESRRMGHRSSLIAASLVAYLRRIEVVRDPRRYLIKVFNETEAKQNGMESQRQHQEDKRAEASWTRDLFSGAGLRTK